MIKSEEQIEEQREILRVKGKEKIAKTVAKIKAQLKEKDKKLREKQRKYRTKELTELGALVQKKLTANMISNIRNMSSEELFAKYEKNNVQISQENSPELEALNRAIIDAAIAHAKIINPDVKLEDIPVLLKQPIKSDIDKILDKKENIYSLLVQWGIKYKVILSDREFEKIQKYKFTTDCFDDSCFWDIFHSAIAVYEEKQKQ